MSIAVNNLTKIYGAQKAVNNISFTINKGEIVGFLGPNGAGKSTTMKMITGYLKADSGNAVVCDITVDESCNETKKKIGYLPEANPLYHEMYVREYLNFIAHIHLIPKKSRLDLKGAVATEMHHLSKTRKARIEEVIDMVGLTIEANKKIGQLSKGYKQRVGLAAALIHDPEVLILDEPTSGLDPNQIVEIREVIKELGKDKTVLFSSHIMQEVEAICDRVIIINKGNIVADDKLSNLQKGKTDNHVVLVQFKENVPVEMLKEIAEVTGIEQPSTFNYQLSTANAESVRKQLMELSLKNNWNIVSLQSKSNSLEDVFRNLTSNNN